MDFLVNIDLRVYTIGHMSEPTGDLAGLSRRERRELKRFQQLDTRQSEHRQHQIRRLMLWGAALVLLGGIGWFMYRAASNVVLPTESNSLTVPVSASDHSMGPVDAPITLVEYSDYQCPACGAFYPLIKQALNEPALKGRVRFVYRNFPLSQHQNAQLAARAAEAAGLQGKYWEMHDLLFEHQSAWSELSDTAARAIFTGYAQSLSLDMTAFGKDIDSSVVKNRIKTDQDGGLQAQVDSTPTFFVNGKHMIAPNNYEQFKQYILDGAVISTPTPTNS